MNTQEVVVLVNKHGKPTGKTLPKWDAHHSDTPFHLGFSCYVFDEQGRFLVTQRAKSKKVWPGVWTNTVCGHPALDESIENAIKRRLVFELGMEAKAFDVLLPKYSYTTPPYNGIIENEFCPVYVANVETLPNPNPKEVEDYRWMNWNEFVVRATNDDENLFSYWCKDQLKQLVNHPALQQYS